MKWIRWWGIAVFAAMVAVILAAWFLLAGYVVERAVETAGARIVGAKVELDDADLTISPLGVTLKGLRVTDPDLPMTNAIEARRIVFSLEAPALFRRKVIIDALDVEGLRFGTPRKSSGALTRGSKKRTAERPSLPQEGARQRLNLPAFDLPDAKEIIRRERLRSVELVESIREDIEKDRIRWKKDIEGLPDRDRIEEYRRRMEGLGSVGKEGLAGILAGAGELMRLQKELKDDLERISKATRGIEETIRSYERKIEAVRRAAEEDARRLAEKYTLSAEGLGKISLLIFGARITALTDRAVRWYVRLRPLVERVKEKRGAKEIIRPLRGRGVYVRFRERHPSPDLLVRRARLSVSLPGGDVHGSVTNITPDQDVLGRPLEYRFLAERLEGLKSLDLAGVIDHVDPARSRDSADLKLRGYRVKELSLAGGELPVVLKKALADLDVRAALSGGRLRADFSAAFASADIRVERTGGDNPLVEALAAALAATEDFGMKGEVTATLGEGGISNLELVLQSDLDEVLRDAVAGVIRKLAAGLEKELGSAIAERVEGELGGLETGLGVLEGLKKELTGRLGKAP